MTLGSISYRVGGGSKGDARVLRLTLVDPIADEAIFVLHGVSGLRKCRLMRIVREAEDQGVLLGYDDLCTLLLTSRATVKRDISDLESEGYRIPLGRKRKLHDGPLRARLNDSLRKIPSSDLAVGQEAGIPGK